MIRVCLVSTWDSACGIAEHSAMLKEAVEAADPEIEILPCPEALDPFTTHEIRGPIHVYHLNYHAALHSRWTPLAIQARRQTLPVLVTFHDTGVPNSGHCKAVIDAATAAVVHEPFADLPEGKVRYWRMGVPETEIPDDPAWADRPYLGTVGFPFPWKCYDDLCRTAAQHGWGVYLIAPTATAADAQRWRDLNPWVIVEEQFLHRDRVIDHLRSCDATAFCYVTHNTGQSGAILLGIAAGKPVFAFETCRQFRALRLDPLGAETIAWGETFADLGRWLRTVRIGRWDPGIVALREQESWRHLGRKYARLYRELAEGSHA